MSDFGTSEAAKRLNTSRNSLLRWFREGRIQEVRRDRRGWRTFSESDLERIRRELGESSAPLAEGRRLKMRAYLKRVPCLARLGDQVLDELASIANFRGYLESQTLFTPGQRSRGLLILVKGKVRIFRTSPEGREQVLAIVTPFQMLGEAVLFRSDERHTSHATCLQGSTVMSLPLVPIRELTQQHPQLAFAFLGEFASRIEDLETRLEDLALLSLDQRLAKFLLDQAGNGHQFHLERPTGELASLLGAARESLSRSFARLEDEGLIRRQGQTVSLLDNDRLKQL